MFLGIRHHLKTSDSATVVETHVCMQANTNLYKENTHTYAKHTACTHDTRMQNTLRTHNTYAKHTYATRNTQKKAMKYIRLILASELLYSGLLSAEHCKCRTGAFTSQGDTILLETEICFLGVS